MDDIDIIDEESGLCTDRSVPIVDNAVQVQGPRSDIHRSFGSGGMENSQFGQVVFHEVDDIYPTDCDLRCCYTLTESIQAVQGDRIALYKVGWKYITDYLIFKLAPIPLEEKGYPTLRIAFSASMLPKDESDLYQLCYLTIDNLVTGASVPFVFRRPNANELVAVEDKSSPGMMIYKSRVAILYDRISCIEDEKELLELKVTALMSQLGVLEKEVAYAASNSKLLCSSLDCVKLDLERERVTHMELKNKYTQLSEVYDECKKKIDKNEKEVSEKDVLLNKFEKDLADSVKELKSMDTELANLRSQNVEKELMLKEVTQYSETLKVQFENLKYEQASFVTATTAATAVVSVPPEVEQLQHKLMDAEETREMLQNKIVELQSQLGTTTQLLESVLQEQNLGGMGLQTKIVGSPDCATEALEQDLNASRNTIEEKDRLIEELKKECSDCRLECSARIEEIMKAFENTDRQHELQKNELKAKIGELEAHEGSKENSGEKEEELMELVAGLRQMLLEMPPIEDQWRLLLESARVLAKEHYKELLNNFEFLSSDQLTGVNLKVQKLVDALCVTFQCLESSKEQCHSFSKDLERCRNEIDTVSKEKSCLERTVIELNETINEIGNCLQVVKKDSEGTDVKDLRKQLAEVSEKKACLEKEVKQLKTEKALTNIGNITVDQVAMAAELERLRRRLTDLEVSSPSQAPSSSAENQKHCEKLQDYLKRSATEYAKLYHKFLKERQQRVQLESLVTSQREASLASQQED